MAIIGGGFGGLACARALQLARDSSTSLSCHVFEQCDSSAASETGEILLPSADAVLHSLGLGEQWERLRREAKSPRANSLPRRALLCALINSLQPGTLVCGVSIVDVIVMPGERWCCKCADGSTPREPTALRALRKPFDLVIDAGGLSTPASILAHAAVGDARKARVPLICSLPVLARRIAYGADDALREGAALGAILGAAVRTGELSPRLGCYRCRRTRRVPSTPTEALVVWSQLRRGAALLVVALMLASVALRSPALPNVGDET